MSLYIRTNLSTHLRLFTTFPPVNKFLHFNKHHFTCSALNNSSTQESFTVSYLINSCGLSSKHALSACKHVKFNSPENADLVIALFKKHGFTDTHVSKMVKKLPGILSSDFENTIFPKLEYLTSIGLSRIEVNELVADSPQILKRSLVNSIIPTCDFLKSQLKTGERTIRAAKSFLAVKWLCDLETLVVPNIESLRELGVKESSIVSLLTTNPSVLMNGKERFRVIAGKVKDMGFNPQQVNFVCAFRVLISMSKSTWEKKVESLKEWGWSEDDVYAAFGKFPWFMVASVDKLSSIMDMVINKSGFNLSDVVQRPQCLAYSLKRRVVPRCLVYQVLLDRGLIRKKWSLQEVLRTTDEQFIKKITLCSKEAAPELLKIYHQKLEMNSESLVEEQVMFRCI